MDTPAPIRVLVLDDSQTLRRFVTRVLEGTGRFHVCGLSDTGRGAARAVARTRPDVVVLDIDMPGVDGLAATREIMGEEPRPIVVFCGVDDPKAQGRAFEALEAGAVALVPKPGPGQPLESAAAELVRTVEVARGVRLVSRRAATSQRVPVEPLRPPPLPRAEDRTPAGALPRVGTAWPSAAGRTGPIIAIGASTGGPPALRQLLAGLPADLEAAVLIVQHITPGFLLTFVDWLGTTVPHPVSVARADAEPHPGNVYVAPNDAHLVLRGGRLALDTGPARNGHRPSVDPLFESLASGSPRPLTTAVLLTGMGDDGARGLLALRKAGADTIAQDEATSAVYGMPRAARDLGAARQVLPLERIAEQILASPAGVLRRPRR